MTERTKPADTTEENDESGKDGAQQIVDFGSALTKTPHGSVYCMTIIGQIEGHNTAASGAKTTKYEHVIPQLVSIEEDPEVEGLLVILNTVGGDVEAGLALAELISGITKPSATLVLGGGHSIGIPLAVSARRSFIVPTRAWCWGCPRPCAISSRCSSALRALWRAIPISARRVSPN